VLFIIAATEYLANTVTIAASEFNAREAF